MNNKQTIPEQMLSVLEDGRPHPVDELHALCGPSLRGVVMTHICLLRKKLPEGQAILCVLHRRAIHYQLVYLYQKAINA